MKSTTFIATLLCLLGLQAHRSLAQETENPTVQVEMTLMCWDNELELTYPGHDAKKPIIAPMQVRSSIMTYEGPATYQLSSLLPPTEDGTIRSAPLAQVTLPPDSEQVLVILIPNKSRENAMPYNALVIDDRYEIFPKQSVRFLNFTSQKLTGQLGPSKFEIEPRGQTIAKPEVTTGPKHLVPFRMVRFVSENESWRPVISTVFSMPSNIRILVLLLEDPNEPFQLRFVLLRDLIAKDQSEVIDT